MSEINDQGVTLDDFDTILARIIAALKGKFGDDIRTDDQSNFGIMARLLANNEVNYHQLVRGTISAHSPSQAGGVFLQELARFNGVFRNSSRFSTVIQTVTANAAGAHIDAGSIVTDAEESVSVALDAAVDLLPLESKDVSATATEAGPLSILAGTLTVIKNPAYGWATTVNANDGVEGAYLEPIPALRMRRELAAASTSTVSDEARGVAVANVEGVVDVQVRSNRGTGTDGFGAPSGALMTSVKGGADAAIAQAIYEHTAGGLGWWGTSYYDYTAASGTVYRVYYSRPVVVPVYVAITVRVNREYGFFPGDGPAQIKQKIIDFFDASQKLGIDVARARISYAAQAVPGHAVQSARIGTNPLALTDDDIVITFGQEASIEAADITVVVQ